MRGVLDTSVFIAEEQGRDLAAERLPDEAAISVVTLAELTIGAHLAEAETVHAQRLRTVQAAQATYAALPVDEAVAAAFADWLRPHAGMIRVRRSRTRGSLRQRAPMAHPSSPRMGISTTSPSTSYESDR
jgi:predicted nucleic acid-binding protein